MRRFIFLFLTITTTTAGCDEPNDPAPLIDHSAVVEAFLSSASLRSLPSLLSSPPMAMANTDICAGRAIDDEVFVGKVESIDVLALDSDGGVCPGPAEASVVFHVRVMDSAFGKVRHGERISVRIGAKQLEGWSVIPLKWGNNAWWEGDVDSVPQAGELIGFSIRRLPLLEPEGIWSTAGRPLFSVDPTTHVIRYQDDTSFKNCHDMNGELAETAHEIFNFRAYTELFQYLRGCRIVENPITDMHDSQLHYAARCLSATRDTSCASTQDCPPNFRCSEGQCTIVRTW